MCIVSYMRLRSSNFFPDGSKSRNWQGQDVSKGRRLHWKVDQRRIQRAVSQESLWCNKCVKASLRRTYGCIAQVKSGTNSRSERQWQNSFIARALKLRGGLPASSDVLSWKYDAGELGRIHAGELPARHVRKTRLYGQLSLLCVRAGVRRLSTQPSVASQVLVLL